MQFPLSSRLCGAEDGCAISHPENAVMTAPARALDAQPAAPSRAAHARRFLGQERRDAALIATRRGPPRDSPAASVLADYGRRPMPGGLSRRSGLRRGAANAVSISRRAGAGTRSVLRREHGESIEWLSIPTSDREKASAPNSPLELRCGCRPRGPRDWHRNGAALRRVGL